MSGEIPPWLRSIRVADRPLYAALADAIAAAIASGELGQDARLPPLRELASLLEVDYTTVSRGYAEAGRRGLVEGRVGQGTFVRAGRQPRAGAAADVADLSMNAPPRFDDPALEARMWRGIAALEQTGGLDLLLRYRPPAGVAAARGAGLRWLSARLPSATLDRVLVCPGAQGAMLAAAGVLTEPDALVLTERLTYPGFRALAARLRLRVEGVALDREGLDPDDLDLACRREKPAALYCSATLHNPTTATMSLARREAVVRVARRHGVPIIEDDAYGALLTEKLPPLAALAPELVWYIGGFAKPVAPALRIAWLVAPDQRGAARATGEIRASAMMASPLTAAIATGWIEDGTADAVLAAIHAETRARQTIAAEILAPFAPVTHADAFHLWLPLTEPWNRVEFMSRPRPAGIGIVTSNAFAVGPAPEAVRIGLGTADSRDSLARGLQAVAAMLEQSPALSSTIV